MTVDLILCAGQSNMAGRGISTDQWPEKSPEVIQGAGWEFRAITAPDRLCPICDPFGVEENRPDGIDDRWGDVRAKTGSMIPAFVNAYFRGCAVPVVCVSASKGGSMIREWQPGSKYLTDALARLQSAKEYLQKNNFTVRHTFCLWCQGESDGDGKTAPEDYRAMFEAMLTAMRNAGVEQLLMVRIGQCNKPEDPDRYQQMIALQDAIAETTDQVTMVSTCLAGMRDRGLMKDSFHYYQQAYNEAGTEAGRNAAMFANVCEQKICKMGCMTMRNLC